MGCISLDQKTPKQLVHFKDLLLLISNEIIDKNEFSFLFISFPQRIPNTNSTTKFPNHKERLNKIQFKYSNVENNRITLY